MKQRKNLLLLWVLFAIGMQVEAQNFTSYVNKWIGTGGDGRITPVASVPFGMMQIGPDTRSNGSGYNYADKNLLGFSLLHKNGGGCNDFLDILFMPLRPGTRTDTIRRIASKQYKAPLSHQEETASPGFYAVNLYDRQVQVALTATKRCGFQRYEYTKGKDIPLLLDLQYGSDCACTIQPEHDVDTVYSAYVEIVDNHTIRGWRKSNGWAYHQQVYFCTTFSQPIASATFYLDNERVGRRKSLQGENVKLLLTFANEQESLTVKTALSSADMDGAANNLQAEGKAISFDEARAEAVRSWNKALGQIEVSTADKTKKEIFYTSLHNVLMYPMLFSDADGRFLGPDDKVHRATGFNDYAAVVGFWDTFRAACPLMAVLHPDVMSDYVKTCLLHYDIFGQLPIWTLAGKETFQMIGIHALPVITNCYLNGIKDFDANKALQAMIHSANKDTCGYSMGYFVGLKNYKKYGYVPCDLEMEATARTLEYAFDDRAIGVLANALGERTIAHDYFMRSLNYRNVIDPETGLARGRLSDGSWKSPFRPLRSAHRRDDYCEGNAWQWTFFVPHDVEGLASCMGGNAAFEAKLDTFFTMTSKVEGEQASGDISGMIGQYAHGNEPGHHTIYMYNKVGRPDKAQRYIHEVINTLYRNTPDGICGNEDTGQMSAWYVFSSLGFYPMDPTSGQYQLGTPSFDQATIHLPSGKDFTIQAKGLTPDRYLVKAVYLNGKKLDRSYITFDELLQGGELQFIMQ